MASPTTRTDEIIERMRAFTRAQYEDDNIYNHGGITVDDVIGKCTDRHRHRHRHTHTFSAAQERAIRQWGNEYIKDIYDETNLPPRPELTGNEENKERLREQYHQNAVIPTAIGNFTDCRLKPESDFRRDEKEFCKRHMCQRNITNMHEANRYLAANPDDNTIRYCRDNYTATMCPPPHEIPADTTYPLNHFVDIDNAGAGNCLFLSALKFIEIEAAIAAGAPEIDVRGPYDSPASLTLREHAIQWLIDNDSFENAGFTASEYFEAVAGSVESYLERMHDPREWGGTFEEIALSRHLGRTIVILQKNDALYEIRSAHEVRGSVPIFLIHTGAHYRSMIPAADVPGGFIIKFTTVIGGQRMYTHGTGFEPIPRRGGRRPPGPPHGGLSIGRRTLAKSSRGRRGPPGLPPSGPPPPPPGPADPKPAMQPCIICNTILPADEMIDHVNCCLDDQQLKNDAEMARGLAEPSTDAAMVRVLEPTGAAGGPSHGGLPIGGRTRELSTGASVEVPATSADIDSPTSERYSPLARSFFYAYIKGYMDIDVCRKRYNSRRFGFKAGEIANICKELRLTTASLKPDMCRELHKFIVEKGWITQD